MLPTLLRSHINTPTKISRVRDGSSITINGQHVVGRNIEIHGDHITIDGEPYEGADSLHVTIEIHGDVGQVETSSGNVTAKSVSGKVKTMSGDITVAGDVGGNVKTMSGDVSAGTIHGGVSTMSGDIKR
ncbi:MULTISPECIES: hypothetical protein [Halomonas]|uniref:hypothetical protein n=1 Tax=Halomonas TaxID=2745 RepID=UPI003CE8A4C3